MAGCLLVRTALFRSSSVTGRCLPAARSAKRQSGNPSPMPSRSESNLAASLRSLLVAQSDRQCCAGRRLSGPWRITHCRTHAGTAEEAVFQPWRSHSVVVRRILLLGLIGFLIVLLQKHRRREQLEQTRLIQAQRHRGGGAHRRWINSLISAIRSGSSSRRSLSSGPR